MKQWKYYLRKYFEQNHLPFSMTEREVNYMMNLAIVNNNKKLMSDIFKEYKNIDNYILLLLIEYNHLDIIKEYKGDIYLDSNIIETSIKYNRIEIFEYIVINSNNTIVYIYGFNLYSLFENKNYNFFDVLINNKQIENKPSIFNNNINTIINQYLINPNYIDYLKSKIWIFIIDYHFNYNKYTEYFDVNLFKLVFAYLY